MNDNTQMGRQATSVPTDAATSIDEFFDLKEPEFRDWYVREMLKTTVYELGAVCEQDMLDAMKRNERKRFG